MITRYFSLYKRLMVAGLFIPFFFCASAIEKRPGTIIQPNPDLFMQIGERDSITLCWDPPAQDADSAVSYELSYHTEKNSTFIPFKTVPASINPSVIVKRKDIPVTDSIFYFCVRSVTKTGNKSNCHNCSDPDAIPEGGWFLFWK